MKKTEQWRKLINSLPIGLSQSDAARRLGFPNGTVRLWIRRLNYRFNDGRRRPWTESRRKKFSKLIPENADWTKSNIFIAKSFGVSRERVRQIREHLGLKKINGRK